MTVQFFDFSLGVYFFATGDYKVFELPMDEDELAEKIKEINWQDGDYEVQEYNTPFENGVLRNYTISQINEVAEMVESARVKSERDAQTLIHQLQYMMEEESGLEIWELKRKAEDRLMLIETDGDSLAKIGGELFDIFLRDRIENQDEEMIQTLMFYFDFEHYANDFITNNQLRLSNYGNSDGTTTWIYDFEK